MKNTIFLLFLSRLLFCCPVFAQQNLFNVPSSEITAKQKLFFQQQLNINSTIQSNTNFCFGLGKGFEVGINFIGVQSNVSFRRIKVNDSLDNEPLAPLGLVTFQKVFEVNKSLKIGLGTQLGTNLLAQTKKAHHLADFTYLNTSSSFFDEKLKCNAGWYFSDKAYEGEKSRLGYMMGCEFALNSKVHLVGDWIQGKNPIGVSVVGFIYYVRPKIPISFGWQIPNSKQKSSQAFVFELTYVPTTS